MAIESNILDLAVDKKFTDFSKAVKHELKTKLSKHDVVKRYVSDFDKIQQMKQSFASIAKIDDVKDITSEKE